MRTNVESKIGSTIYNRIQAVRMPEADRQRALHTLADAEMVVDAFVWVAKKIERFTERLFQKQPTTALKH
jgi:hypothetical protein